MLAAPLQLLLAAFLPPSSLPCCQVHQQHSCSRLVLPASSPSSSLSASSGRAASGGMLMPLPLPLLPLLPPRGAALRCAAPVAMVKPAFEFAFDDDDEDDYEDTDEDEEGSDAAAARRRAKIRKENDAELNLTDQPAENMTVTELQTQLKQLGQRHTGTRSVLVERIQLMQRKRALGLPIHDMQIQREADMQWYMLQTANGFERSVEASVNMAIRAQRLESKIEKVWVPILEGETSVRDSSVMPSYIFIRMAMDENLHFLISDMQYVINFVGADRGGRSMGGQMAGNRGFVRPMPVSDEAYERAVALTRVKVNMGGGAGAEGGEGGDGANAAAPAFTVADIAEVVEGPFKGMQGPVLAVGSDDGEGEGEGAAAAAAADADAQTVTLALTVMGRDTPVTLPMAHCLKIGTQAVAEEA
jgi:transcription antitermination factor NusG